MPVSHVLRARRGVMTLLPLISFVVLSFMFLPLSAQSQTIQGPDLSNPAYAADNVYPYWGQCTWYAWGRAKENDNYPLKHMGNAENWKVNSQTPTAHSIAVWTNSKKGNGHVAYVEKVDGDDVWITEANYSNFRPGVSKNDDVGGGFDGCHIVTKKEMSQRGDLKLKGYITYPITDAPPPATIQHTCTRGKALRVNKDEGFSYTQSGNQVTVTFKGDGFQQGAKVIAQGIGWNSDEVVIVSNTGKELVAVLGVQDAATFTVAIQNPDMEMSKSKELTVTAAPPVQVSDVQPVPSQEPGSTPAIAPDVPPLVIPSGQSPSAEPQTPAPASDTSPAQQTTGTQPLTISPAQQPVGDSTVAQSPDSQTDQTTPIPPSAQTPGTPTVVAGMPPVLLRVSPRQHTPGQFTVDLWGINFQSGAKLIAQGNGWSSDQAAVTFINSTHLQATIVAQDPAQFTLAVQNPDTQTSSAHGFVVTALQTGTAVNPFLPGTTATVPANTPVPDSGSPQQPAPTPMPVTPADTIPNPISSTANNSAPNANAGTPGFTAAPSPAAPAGIMAAPVLRQITPVVHVAGRFVIDLYGDGFQPGAKLIAQGNGWSSDKAAVSYLAPNHLQATIDAANPAQFTVAVQNPDQQISASQSMQVIAAVAVSPTAPRAPIVKPSIMTANRGPESSVVPATNVPPRGPGNAPVPGRSASAPVLSQVTPDAHAAGRFSVDLYGSGFQPGAKLIAQGNGWNSDQAAVMYLGPDHLRAVIDAANPSQFTVAVRNPDSQVSAAHPFQVTEIVAVGVPKSGHAIDTRTNPSSTRGVSVTAPSGAPSNAGTTISTAHPNESPIRPPVTTPTPAQHTVYSSPVTTPSRPGAPISNPQIQPMSIRPMPVTTPTPAQHTVSSSPVTTPSRPGTPISNPQIQPMPQTIKPMTGAPPSTAAYPPSNVTNKPVLRPPSTTNTVSRPTQAPMSVPVPANRVVIPTSPPATARPVQTQLAQPRPTPTPVIRPQPQTVAPPARVTQTPPPARVYTPPPPPPRVAPQPTPQPSKTPTPKKP